MLCSPWVRGRGGGRQAQVKVIASRRGSYTDPGVSDCQGRTVSVLPSADQVMRSLSRSLKPGSLRAAFDASFPPDRFQ